MSLHVAGSLLQYWESVALCRPRHRYSTDNSPHSFRVRILAPSLWFALSMDLSLGPQGVSTCFSLRLLMSRRLLVHDFNIGRAWRCDASCRYNSPHSFRVRILVPTLISFTMDAVSF